MTQTPAIYSPEWTLSMVTRRDALISTADLDAAVRFLLDRSFDAEGLARATDVEIVEWVSLERSEEV